MLLSIVFANIISIKVTQWMPALRALWNIEQGDYWKHLSCLLCCFIEGMGKGKTSYLQRAWDTLMSPLPLPHGSRGLWPFTCSSEDKVPPWTFNQLLEESWRCWTRGAKSRHTTRGFTVWLSMLWFHSTLLTFIKIYAFAICFYPREPSGY